MHMGVYKMTVQRKDLKESYQCQCPLKRGQARGNKYTTTVPEDCDVSVHCSVINLPPPEQRSYLRYYGICMCILGPSKGLICISKNITKEYLGGPKEYFCGVCIVQVSSTNTSSRMRHKQNKKRLSPTLQCRFIPIKDTPSYQKWGVHTKGIFLRKPVPTKS